MKSCCECWNINMSGAKLKPSISPISESWFRPLLCWMDRTIPFVDHVKYLGVIFDKTIVWWLHIETVATIAFRTFLCTYPLSISRHLRITFKLTLHKAVIRSVMTYVCLAWEFAAATFLNCSTRKTRFCAPLVTSQGTYQPTNCMHLLSLYVCDFITQ